GFRSEENPRQWLLDSECGSLPGAAEDVAANAADCARLQQRVTALRSALGALEHAVGSTPLSVQTQMDIAALRRLVDALDPINDLYTHDEVRQRLIKARHALELITA